MDDFDATPEVASIAAAAGGCLGEEQLSSTDCKVAALEP
jgi:hypothetical protein